MVDEPAPDFLRLSAYVLPEIRQGIHILMPQNLGPGAERVDYARRVIEEVTQLVAHGSVALARQYRENIMFGAYLTKLIEDPVTGAVTVEALPELEQALGLDVDALGILLRDGRLRDGGAMAYLQVGAATPVLAQLLARLHHGVRRTELVELAAANDLGFDDDLIDTLLAQGILEPGRRNAPASEVDPAVTWMGHAYVRAASGGKSVWFDPFPMPRMRWTEAERATLFETDAADAVLLDGYGPDAHHVTQDELPLPDAVFITHQDTDHLDLGALALLPASVPIYVPRPEPGRPWELDLVAVIRAVLGPDREVRHLAHGETVEVGELRVTALPFIGEFPTALPHAWNVYLLELPNQVWTMFADSAVTDLHVELLRQRLAGDARPLGIMVSQITPHATSPGYADVAGLPITVARLYSWYLPAIGNFASAPVSGVPPEVLARLVTEAGLRHVYPYAHGNLPWYRLEGGYVLESHVGSHPLATFEAFENIAMQLGASVVRLRHGEPWAPSTFAPVHRRRADR